MSRDIASKDNGSLFRSKNTVRLVRIEPNGKVIDAELPYGRGWGAMTPLDYINQGWRSYDEYAAEQHQKEVAARKAASPSDDAKMDKGKK